MKSKLLNDSGHEKTFLLVFETGDEVIGGLQQFAREFSIGGARLTAIGALQDAVIAYFDWDRKDYVPMPVQEQVEVAGMIGRITIDEDGSPLIHVHVVLGRRDGSTLGGHLKSGRVRPTLELFLTEGSQKIHRRKGPESGLSLISL